MMRRFDYPRPGGLGAHRPGLPLALGARLRANATEAPGRAFVRGREPSIGLADRTRPWAPPVRPGGIAERTLRPLREPSPRASAIFPTSPRARTYGPAQALQCL